MIETKDVRAARLKRESKLMEAGVRRYAEKMARSHPDREPEHIIEATTALQHGLPQTRQQRWRAKNKAKLAAYMRSYRAKP